MRMPTNDLRAFDRLAVKRSVALLADTTDDDLARSTPCAGWTLRDLLVHMTAQHRGFGAAVAGRGADRAVWQADARGDILAAYRDSAATVVAAFAGVTDLERPATLPELSGDFPAGWAIGFHFVDYVVHSWDVARTLDRPVVFPADLLATALEIAQLVPDGPDRLAPGAAFAPAVPVDSADPLDQIVALLGRQP